MTATTPVGTAIPTIKGTLAGIKMSSILFYETGKLRVVV